MSDTLPPVLLRPVFTKQVIEMLKKRKSCNVYGTDAQGMNRFIENLKDAAPPGTKVIHLSMKQYANSFSGFLVALADALGIEVASDTKDIRLLLQPFTKLSSGSEPTIWLCLSHFDRLEAAYVDNKPVDGVGYDLNFLNFLNSISTNPNNINLLVCSDKLLKTTELYIGNKAVRGSELDFSERMGLPSLLLTEIEEYLFYRIPSEEEKRKLKRKRPSFFEEMKAEISRHFDTVPFLEYIAMQPISSIADRKEYEERMAYWKQHYRSDNKRNIDRKIGAFESWTKKCWIRVKRLMGIGRKWREMHQWAKIAWIAALPLVLTLYTYGSKLLAFFSDFFKN